MKFLQFNFIICYRGTGNVVKGAQISKMYFVSSCVIIIIFLAVFIQRGNGMVPKGPDGMVIPDNDMDFVDTWKVGS